ncbi:MAG TPA: M23 family metallopeptidase, partial [Firmicutes bacterium]|nr:M23 family metallopeptidase [Bacillota bacterium]
MNYIKIIILPFIIFLSLISCKIEETPHTREEEPEKILPLSNSPGITSSYGEYRLGAFHMGIDFSTEREVGRPVFAVKDGYVWRIRQDRTGYGKVIYLKHGDGTMTVYAHLSSFRDSGRLKIQQRMDTRIETSGRKYGHQITFGPHDFPVKQGN